MPNEAYGQSKMFDHQMDDCSTPEAKGDSLLEDTLISRVAKISELSTEEPMRFPSERWPSGSKVNDIGSIIPNDYDKTITEVDEENDEQYRSLRSTRQ